MTSPWATGAQAEQDVEQQQKQICLEAYNEFNDALQKLILRVGFQKDFEELLVNGAALERVMSRQNEAGRVHRW